MTDRDDHQTSAQDENQIIALRREKLAALREKGEAFPNGFDCRDQAALLQSKFADTSREALEAETAQVQLAGRIIRQRGPFLVIQDVSGQIQLYLNNKSFAEDEANLIKSLDLGDIIGVQGEMFRTQKDELTVRVQSFTLLTKSLRPLPDKHKGLTDTEMRYRQRYVDLIVNEDSRRVFQLRSRLLMLLRQFFAEREFMEVETPMMQVIPGGATARPFVTHHNALDQDMYLRVAPELFLKRLTVGGFERVFELNRNFRNEGLSTRHNPEFTMLEFYQAYATYEDLMDLTEELFRFLAQQLLDRLQFDYQGDEIDFGKDFQRLTVGEAILAYCEDIKAEDLASEKALRATAERCQIKADKSWGPGKVLMEIFEERVEHKLIQPTFITAYPIEVSPLARRNDDNPEITDRFELIVGGRELANGFSELNDPEDQAARFRAQVAAKDAGDLEAMHFDEDYITALEYGMPPTAGEGIGIDRLVMLLSDSPSIKDVLLFPHMRPAHDGD